MKIVFIASIVCWPVALIVVGFLFDSTEAGNSFLVNFLAQSILWYPVLVLVSWPISRRLKLKFGFIPDIIWFCSWGWAAVAFLLGPFLFGPLFLGGQWAHFQPVVFHDATHFMCPDGNYLAEEPDESYGGISISWYANSAGSAGSSAFVASKYYDRPEHRVLSLDTTVTPEALSKKIAETSQCKNSEGKNIFEVYTITVSPTIEDSNLSR